MRKGSKLRWGDAVGVVLLGGCNACNANWGFVTLDSVTLEASIHAGCSGVLCGCNACNAKSGLDGFKQECVIVNSPKQFMESLSLDGKILTITQLFALHALQPPIYNNFFFFFFLFIYVSC